MESKKVSALMLTHKRLEMAKTSIECFLSQTYENKELIIVNSGGIHYFNRLNDFIKFQNTDKIKHVLVNRKIDTTMGDLRNHALTNATGDYCCVWDDDDFYSKTRIESSVYFLEKMNVDYVMFQNFIVKLNGKTKHSIRNKKGLEPTLMFRSCYNTRYASLNRHEDTDFIRRMKEKGLTSYIIDNDKNDYIYNFHGDNISPFNHFKEIISVHGVK